VEASSQVIEDAAHAHGLEGILHHLQCESIHVLLPVAQEEEEVVSSGELGCAAKAAILGVVDGGQGIIALLQEGFIDRLIPQRWPEPVLL